MNIKKELIKAGFDDQTNLTNDEQIDFEMWHDLPEGEQGTASIRLQKMKGTDDVEVTVYSDSGYELLIGMTEQEAG
tara:strand:- start:125 stop:352 length:228 start_codon:yes stop_codon:yes gene_type:complete